MPEKITAAPAWEDVFVPQNEEEADENSLRVPYRALTARTEYLKQAIEANGGSGGGIGMPSGEGFVERHHNNLQLTPLLNEVKPATQSLLGFAVLGFPM